MYTEELLRIHFIYDLLQANVLIYIPSLCTSIHGAEKIFPLVKGVAKWKRLRSPDLSEYAKEPP